MSRGAEGEVEALLRLDLAGLRAVWARAYGPPPKLRSVELLRFMLAWRLQAAAAGGLDRAARRQLARTGGLEAEGLHLGCGATLVRSWKGHRIEVEVAEGGFCWEGRLYPSLSACATAIAGSRWNGPRFFGLRAAR
jgi:hypothetical protein